MNQLKTFWHEHQSASIAILVFILYLVTLRERAIPYGLNSLYYYPFRFIVIFAIFAFFLVFFLLKEKLLVAKIANHQLIAKLPTIISKNALAIIVVLVMIIFAIPLLLVPKKMIYDTIIFNNTTATPTPEVTNSEDVSFVAGNNTAWIWVGSMLTDKSGNTLSEHVTYTAEFGYQVVNVSKKAVKVEVTDIAIHNQVPSGKLYIIPKSHVSASQNGGSITSTQNFEDWNTFGYSSASDYTKMKSLNNFYSPKICDSDYNCDYNDEVARQSGLLGLRFKYIDVARTTNINTAYDIASHEQAYEINRNQMDATMSWKLKITLDDGTVHEKKYSVTVKGSDFVGTTNSSERVKF